MVDAFKPNSVMEALNLLAFEDCIIFAGGTDLMVKKRQWSGTLPSFEKPVMFISEIPELKQVSIDDNHIAIGAGCTFAQLINSQLIPEHYKLVFREIASPGIRNTATIGGNICNSSPAGDSLPLLYTLNAKLILESSCRKLEVPIEDFILGPGKNILKSGELVTAIKIPVKDFNFNRYKKVGTRKSTALSKLSFVGLACFDEEGLKDVRIAFGAVAPTVVRNREIEEELLAMHKSRNIDMNELCSYYDILIKPIDDQRSTAVYRRMVCKNLLSDFIKNLL